MVTACRLKTPAAVSTTVTTSPLKPPLVEPFRVIVSSADPAMKLVAAPAEPA